MEHGTAAQVPVSGEQRPPTISLSEQDGPVRRRLVRAPDDVRAGLSEVRGIRPQKLLEASRFGKHAAEVGVPVRHIAEEPRESVLAQAPGYRVPVDRPAIAAPALGIEEIYVERLSRRVQKEVAPVDGQLLEEGRKGERHLGTHPAAHQRDVLPAPVDLPQNP